MDRRNFLRGTAGAAGVLALGGAAAVGGAQPAAAESDGRLSQWHLSREDYLDSEDRFAWTDECQGLSRARYGAEDWWWVVCCSTEELPEWRGIHKLNFRWERVDFLAYDENWWPAGDQEDHVGAIHANDHIISGTYSGRLYVPVEHGTPRVWITKPFGAVDKTPGQMYYLGIEGSGRYQTSAPWCSTDLDDPRHVVPSGSVLVPHGGYLYSSNDDTDMVYGYKYNSAYPGGAPPKFGQLQAKRASRMPKALVNIAGGFVKGGRLYVSREGDPGQIICYKFGRENPGTSIHDLDPLVIEGTYTVDETDDVVDGATEIEGLCYAPVEWNDGQGHRSKVSMVILDQNNFTHRQDNVWVKHYDMPAHQAP
ncbi:hypothetical protein [Streptomyces cucumeris]|uniref:hypothetical protein n=1 Tax=Streptomyces cucumeris TaxID=2962890 RepID=UPI003D711C49